MTKSDASKKPITKENKKNIARDSLKSVGLRICAIRKNYTLTQQQLADKLFISRNYLSEIENGRKVPSGPLLAALKSIFMADVEWILNGSGEMLTSSSGKKIKTNNVRHEDIVLLLKGFHSMTDDGRKKLMNILKIFMLVEGNMPGNS